MADGIRMPPLTSLLSLVACLASGCISHNYNLYPGPPRHDDETGALESTAGDQFWISIDAVDGQLLNPSSDPLAVTVRVIARFTLGRFYRLVRKSTIASTRGAVMPISRQKPALRYGFLPPACPTGDRNGWVVGTDAAHRGGVGSVVWNTRRPCHAKLSDRDARLIVSSVRSGRSGAKHFANLCADIAAAHEAFPHKCRAHAGGGEFLHIFTAVNAAFADQHRAVLHQFGEPKRVAQIGMECTQIAVVNPQQAVAASGKPIT